MPPQTAAARARHSQRARQAPARRPRRGASPARCARCPPPRPPAPSAAARPASSSASARCPRPALVDGLLRGRAWIWLIGILLGGIVAMQVSLLKLNAGISRAVTTASTLERQNADFEAQIARLSSGERVRDDRRSPRAWSPRRRRDRVPARAAATATRRLAARPDAAAERRRPPRSWPTAGSSPACWPSPRRWPRRPTRPPPPRRRPTPTATTDADRRAGADRGRRAGRTRGRTGHRRHRRAPGVGACGSSSAASASSSPSSSRCWSSAPLRSVWLGVVKAGTLKQAAVTQQEADITVPARRGTILDREGTELAVSQPA